MCLCVNYEGEVVDAVLQYLEGVFLCFCRAVYVWVGVSVGQCLYLSLCACTLPV